MTAFFTFARPGQSIVYTTPLYGGTTGLIHNFLEPFGVQCDPRALGRTEGHRRAPSLRAKDLRVVYIETPANPTLIMTDIAPAASAAARASGPPAS